MSKKKKKRPSREASQRIREIREEKSRVNVPAKLTFWITRKSSKPGRNPNIRHAYHRMNAKGMLVTYCRMPIPPSTKGWERANLRQKACPKCVDRHAWLRKDAVSKDAPPAAKPKPKPREVEIAEMLMLAFRRTTNTRSTAMTERT